MFFETWKEAFMYAYYEQIRTHQKHSIKKCNKLTIDGNINGYTVIFVGGKI
jgi:hypothetical protein